LKKLFCGLLTAAVAFCLLACPPALAYDGDEIIGTVDTLIRGNTEPGSCVDETDLGDVTADALRAVSGTDVAIVNGGELCANLQAGQCSWADILAVFEENKTLAVADVTPAQLWRLLEYGVSYAVLGADEKTDAENSSFEGFPQVSGLIVQYDLSAPAGERIMYVKLADGRALESADEDTRITLCATEYMLSGGYGYENVASESLNLGLADALADYIAGNTLGLPDSSRIRTIGSYDKPLISRVSVFLVALAICVLSFCINKVRRSQKKENEL